MTSVRGRGRGGLGGPRGGGGDARRGSWRGGPPGSNGAGGGYGSPRGVPGSSPRTSINEHMTNMTKAIDDKTRATPTMDLKTDTDISNSANTAQRELKPWQPETSTPPNGSRGGTRDSETFGSDGPPSNVPWDQFEANTRLFGVTTNYEEEIYTTKLDRSGPDFKQREKEAQKLANEILNQTSTNTHVAEERGQATQGGEEEKYSGVLRSSNAYVPPGARRGAPSLTEPDRALVNGNGGAATPTPAQISDPTLSPASAAPSTQPTISAPDQERSNSEATPVAEKAAPLSKNAAPSPNPSSGPLPAEAAVPTVVDQFRHFVGSERERVEAKKQSILKLDRERTLADLKKFQTNFKVPLPMPKDILPLLSKNEEKQKAIEAKAATALEDAKRKPEPSRTAPKKIAMKIPEIPPFKPKGNPPPPSIPVTASASKDIPQSPSSVASPPLDAAKLNPKASSFVFKPNPAAAAFKPGQSSTVTSPASRPAQVSSPAAGPSVPKNPFFRDQVPMPAKGISLRDEFNPWKHGQVPAASSVMPQWPYTGRKYNAAFMGPPMHPMPLMGGEDDPTSPHGIAPHIGPPNYPPYYRFQGMAPYGVPAGNPMFTPPAGFNQLAGGPMGGPQPNVPIFYHNGIPQNPQFIPQQHMQFHPGQRQGPGPQGGPMFFQHQGLGPQQSPQGPPGVLQQPPPFQSSPMQAPAVTQTPLSEAGSGGP